MQRSGQHNLHAQPPVNSKENVSYNQEPRKNYFPPGFELVQTSQNWHYEAPLQFYQKPSIASAYATSIAAAQSNDPFASLNNSKSYQPSASQGGLPSLTFNFAKTGRSSSSVSSQGSVDKRELPAPPKNNHMYHETRYKTELCRQFEESGICEYGTRCLFAHGSYELKDMKNRHPRYKSELCSSFEIGQCSFGTRCSFLHPKPDFDILLEELMAPIHGDTKWPDMEPVELQKKLMEKMFDMCMPYVTDEARLPVFVSLCYKRK